MQIVSLIIFLIAALIILYGTVWGIIQAFQQSILWGIAYIFLPGASLVFLITAWGEAKKPFFLTILGAGIMLGAFFVMPSETSAKLLKDADLPALTCTQKPAAAPVEPAKPMEAAPAALTIEQRWAALQTREQAILSRKSQLQPGDSEGARTLNQEIAAYNAERQSLVVAAGGGSPLVARAATPVEKKRKK